MISTARRNRIQLNWRNGERRGRALLYRSRRFVTMSLSTLAVFHVGLSRPSSFDPIRSIDMTLDIIAKQIYKRSNNLMHFRCKIHIYRTHQLQFLNHHKNGTYELLLNGLRFKVNRGKSEIEISIPREYIYETNYLANRVISSLRSRTHDPTRLFFRAPCRNAVNRYVSNHD